LALQREFVIINEFIPHPNQHHACTHEEIEYDPKGQQNLMQQSKINMCETIINCSKPKSHAIIAKIKKIGQNHKPNCSVAMIYSNYSLTWE
jgi:hypothetical protein